jgi:hypothetical protein
MPQLIETFLLCVSKEKNGILVSGIPEDMATGVFTYVGSEAAEGAERKLSSIVVDCAETKLIDSFIISSILKNLFIFMVIS